VKQRRSQQEKYLWPYCHIIPVPLAGIGLSTSATHIWRSRIVPDVFVRYGRQCFFCGATETQAARFISTKRKNPFDCHEIWKFDDRRLVATLVKIVPLCTDCHNLTIGQSVGGEYSPETRKRIRPLVKPEQWLADVADISRTAARHCWDKARCLWQIRNRSDNWFVNYGKWCWARGLQPGELWQPPLRRDQNTIRQRLVTKQKLIINLKKLIWLESGYSRMPTLRNTRIERLAIFEGYYQWRYGSDDVLVLIDPTTLRFSPSQ